MRIAAWIIGSMMMALPVFGQQTIQYSQYLFNQFAINPAYAGTAECANILLGMRQQWVGFSGAPQTIVATIHGGIKVERFQRSWHAIGLKIEADETGPYSSKGIYPAYAFHLRIHRDYIASMGFFAGFHQRIYDPNQNPIMPGTAADPIIFTQQQTMVFPDITPGIWIRNNSFFLGASLQQTFRGNMKGFGGSGMVGSPSKQAKHLYFTMGKTLKFKYYKDLRLQPSMHFKWTPLYPPALDLSLMANYLGMIQYGLAYRHPDALIGKVQMKLFGLFRIGYSFDFTTSRIRLGSANTHEIYISASPCLNPPKLPPPDACPTYF